MLKKIIMNLALMAYVAFIFISAFTLCKFTCDLDNSVKASFAEVTELKKGDYVKLNDKYIKYRLDGQEHITRIYGNIESDTLYLSAEVPGKVFNSKSDLHREILKHMGGN